MTAIQYELTYSPVKPHAQEFDQWVHTPEGGHTQDLFIRLAIGLHRAGFKRMGAKAIVERIRWHYQVRRSRGAAYLIDNSLVAFMARHAMDRVPELQGMFNLREAGIDRPERRAVVIPIRERATA